MVIIFKHKASTISVYIGYIIMSSKSATEKKMSRL